MRITHHAWMPESLVRSSGGMNWASAASAASGTESKFKI